MAIQQQQQAQITKVAAAVPAAMKAVDMATNPLLLP